MQKIIFCFKLEIFKELKYEKKHAVIAILEAKIDKVIELKEALIKVANLSRIEKTCLWYHLHQDNDNPTVFVLYENWESKEVHQEQFGKVYIKEFVDKASNLLAKPYQVYMACEVIS